MSHDIDKQIEQVMRAKQLTTSEVHDLTKRIKSVFLEESNVKEIPAPCTIVGDLHGQLADLLEMFEVAGHPPYTNFLFLGDYVDRGFHCVETITLLFLLKLRYPDRITLLRGNHESFSITPNYGFKTECETKYPQEGTDVWKWFCDTFDTIPLCAIVGTNLFCVHGGLSPDLQSVDQIRILNRFQDLPHEGPMADLLWSDPSDEVDGFGVSPRGAGYIFGKDVVNAFIQRNKLTHVIRSHQLCAEGYMLKFSNTLITVWSAPDYCYRMKNIASVLDVDDYLNMFFNTYWKSPIIDRAKPPPPVANYLAGQNRSDSDY
ncbi:putative Protein phosphatase 2A catalytic subunit B [Blattamonas nauphoetae]|uniref:Serine/threonine-protein phosphatase n=1 Tax=Blattamonas nauphoetae TaxID=2049346 RepID=A0ABQ9YFT8_9EUKA|nr:putative Protein phosphatase 2A catalytic subunit B [Blattamonas nauphoetae]